MSYLQGIAPQGPEIYFYMSLTTWSSVTIIFGYFFFKIKIFLLILVSSIFMKLAVSYKWLQYFVKNFLCRSYMDKMSSRFLYTMSICAIKCAWLADSMLSRQNVYSANPFII